MKRIITVLLAALTLASFSANGQQIPTLASAEKTSYEQVTGYLNPGGDTLIYQNGGRILNEALDSCVIASVETEEAFQFLNDLSEKHRVTWSVLAGSILWDDMFAGGRCSMVVNGRWFY